METNMLATDQVSNNPVSQNFYLHSHYLSSLQPDMQVVKTKNLIYTDANLSCDSFNIIYVVNGFEISHQELNQAIRHFDDKNFDYCIWVDQENLTENLGQILRKLKIYEVGNEPGMLYSISSNTNHKALTSDIRKVANPQMVDEFATILASAWTPPDNQVISYYKTIAPSMIQNPNNVGFYLYYQNSKPVAVMEIFPTDQNTAGIYNLVTLAAYRGAGIATKLMQFALSHLAQTGYSKVVLQSSEDGLSIYKKLGFDEVTRYYEFQPK